MEINSRRRPQQHSDCLVRLRWDEIADVPLPCAHRTLLYVEGDATMRQYDDNEGRKQSALSIVQR